MSETRPMTNAEMVTKELVDLHGELGNFQYYFARNQTPPNFESEDYKKIGEVVELIEHEVARIKLITDKEEEIRQREGGQTNQEGK